MIDWPVSTEDPTADLWDAAVTGTTEREDSVDPLVLLRDPAFVGTSWDYEYSHVGDLPCKLHAKQEEARTCGARHRFLFWANQGGKTGFSATEWVDIALGRHPVYSQWPNFEPSVVLWASSLTWELWETVQLPELLSWIPKDRIIDAPEPFAKSTKRIIRIRADNGKESRIEGKSAEQGRAKYQARRVHGIWFDEEHPLPIWQEARMRLVRFGGITLTSATPLKGFTWLYHDIYQPWKQGKSDPKLYFCSHAGMADNPGIPPEEVEQAKQDLRNNKAQLAARLYGKFAAPEGVALTYDPEKHPETLSDEHARQLVSLGSAFAGLDFGSWRFAFTLWAADRDGVVHLIHEEFSQREELSVRARRLDMVLREYGCTHTLRIWGDAANPTDIMELNARFREIAAELDRQRTVQGGHTVMTEVKPFRVVAVGMENKLRSASVERINFLLGRNALRFRRGTMEGRTWLLGYSASSGGTPVEGSRLLWEVANWCYPNPAEGKAQKQDPDDNTADGADAIASMRYALMSWWKPAKQEEEKPVRDPNVDTGLEKLLERRRNESGASWGQRPKLERRGRATKREESPTPTVVTVTPMEPAADAPDYGAGIAALLSQVKR